MNNPNCDWVQPLLGLKWKIGARGPFEYDCWGLLWHVYRTRLNIELPEYPGMNTANVWEVARKIEGVIISDMDWKQIKSPIHLCAVAMSSGRVLHHVGVWLDIDGGLVLHSRDSGAITAQSLRGLSSIGIQRIIYYKHKDHDTSNSYHQSI